MKKSRSCFILPGFLMLLFSCSGSQGNETIRKHKWMISRATTERPIDLNNTGKPSTDLLAQGPSCILDDLFNFNEKGILMKDDNQHICDDPSGKKGTWSFISKDSLLIDFIGQGEPRKYKIIEMSENRMILVTPMPFTPGGIEVTYTFINAD